MSTEMRLARLGLLHLVDNTEALKYALQEKATLLRSSRHIRPTDITSKPKTKTGLLIEQTSSLSEIK